MVLPPRYRAVETWDRRPSGPATLRHGIAEPARPVMGCAGAQYVHWKHTVSLWTIVKMLSPAALVAGVARGLADQDQGVLVDLHAAHDAWLTVVPRLVAEAHGHAVDEER